jgi:aspartate aminotransferase
MFPEFPYPVEQLLEAGVAVMLGTDFGCPDNIRLSFATSMNKIKEGMDRMENFLNQNKEI